MQLVLHAPFGSRINKAWGLALRKRFCRQFNFELQAAATEDGLLLSLGPQHSFPLADVFRYLHPATARDVLVQAFLDAPVFQTRWRWNTTISLAVPRNRHGKKVAPQLQRMLADDLMAAVFPDAAACLENIPGDREIPDHPLVRQAVRDCLQEAMDFDALARVLERIHRGEVQCVARDTTEPSPLCHEILNARPYAFLDDAPLEERRAHAVYARRAGELSHAGDLAALDPAAIERVCDEERPDPRDADELHDALLTAGFLTDEESAHIAPALWRELAHGRRATRVTIGGRVRLLITAERLPELLALCRDAVLEDQISAPPSRTTKVWAPEEALVELLRGRLGLVGPTTARELGAPLGIGEADVDAALHALEAEGVVLRGSFRRDPSAIEWCDRRLLARIHRYTLNRLRAEIEPVSPADFMRFLFDWQHVGPISRASGADGLLHVIRKLDGFECAAGAWEASVLPARVDRYDPSMLDMLCLTGRIGWARLSDGPSSSRLVRSTPVAIFVRGHAMTWKRLATAPDDTQGNGSTLSEAADSVLAALRRQGASFVYELAIGGTKVPPSNVPPSKVAPSTTDGSDELRQALGELVAAGLVTSDGFAGLRAVISDRDSSPRENQTAGRWSVIDRDPSPSPAMSEGDIDVQARALLNRYGVICRRLLTREANALPWRALARAYRRLEARGEIRGGRFVTGLSGEQFALPEAVERLREVRRTPADHRVIVISAADPLNLAGIVTAGERVPAVAATRVAYRDGVPIAAMEGDYIRPLAEIDPASAAEVASALAGRRVPPVLSGFVGRAG
jgi:ATP-dependent Lhr-like helicase